MSRRAATLIRVAAIAVCLMWASLVLARTVTLKHKESGETITGQLLDQRINDRQVFKPASGGTLFLDMGEWKVAGGATAPQGHVDAEPLQRPGESAGAAVAPGKLMTPGEVLGHLFKRYRRLRIQHHAYLEQRSAANARVSNMTKSLAQITTEYRRDKAAVEKVLGAARAVRGNAVRVLSMRPPPRPVLRSLPSRPNRLFYDSVFAYQLALDGWDAECARVRQLNEQLLRLYELNLQRYEDLRRQAAANLTVANAKIVECEAALKALLEGRQETERPLMTERHDLTQGTRASDAEARKLVQDLESTTDAIRGIPEETRLKHGIVEWQGDFYAVAEIQEMHDALAKEIGEVRGAAGLGDGVEDDASVYVPRHPKQEQADDLKALFDKVKAAQVRPSPG